jgi:hypothetical protein
MTKQLTDIVKNNIKFNNAPNEYIIYMNKHITGDINNKYEIIKKFANKNHGETKIVKEPRIVGSNYEMVIELIADVVPMKEFDKLIESK